MSVVDSNDDGFDPTAPEQREIGREIVDESTGLGSVMAAILTWAFSSPDNPHYILLIGIVIVTVFLGIEARRYRDYDGFRSRVRILQENPLAIALWPRERQAKGELRKKNGAGGDWKDSNTEDEPRNR